jgi:hypothetical protein
MILATHGIIQSSQFNPLLDDYPNAAAAYSLRKLRTTYTGNAIRVRRQDNAELDIGFTAAGVLDTDALLAFTGTSGTSNGFIRTWYDQSGNANNAAQITATQQPRIVTAGVLVTQNGKPSLSFDGTNDSLLSTTAIDPLFMTAVNTPNITTFFKTIMGADSSQTSLLGAIYFQYTTPARTASFSRRTDVDTITATFVASSTIQQANNTTNLMTGTRTSNTINIYTNNILRGSGATINGLAPVGGVDSGRFRLMAGYYSDAVADYLAGHLTEFVAYTTDQSSNITGINNNINTHYVIY